MYKVRMCVSSSSFSRARELIYLLDASSSSSSSSRSTSRLTFLSSELLLLLRVKGSASARGFTLSGISLARAWLGRSNRYS